MNNADFYKEVQKKIYELRFEFTKVLVTSKKDQLRKQIDALYDFLGA